MKLKLSDQELAYVILRISVGINMFNHGFARILTGVEKFAVGMTGEFEKSVLPLGMVKMFGLALPWIELIIGALILVGLFSRWAIAAGGLLIFVLLFGVTIIQNWGAAGTQMTYALCFFALLYLRNHNRLSVDDFLKK